MNTAKQIGVLIKKHRNRRKYSQKELSKMIFGDDNHHALISRVENGEHDNVRFDTIYNILKALNIDLFMIIKNI